MTLDVITGHFGILTDDRHMYGVTGTITANEETDGVDTGAAGLEEPTMRFEAGRASVAPTLAPMDTNAVDVVQDPMSVSNETVIAVAYDPALDDDPPYA